MPEICRFLGIIIRMYFDDHAPPHFHVYYTEFSARIDIRNGQLLSGSFPAKQLKHVRDWAKLHRQELLKNWELLESSEPPIPIKP